MRHKIKITFLTSILIAACSSPPDMKTNYHISKAEAERNKLVYYSDYFSFVGKDSIGRVALALDNNRGQDGDSWQADHFVVMHDEKKGWINLHGNGLYPNSTHSLPTIPDSDYFKFIGSPTKGIKITSAPNNFLLDIDPITTRFSKTKGLSDYQLGSAKATLKLGERLISGRVIYEYLFFPSFNRLSRKYVGVFNDFHAIYSLAGENGDFYLHLQKSEEIAPLVGFESGFIVYNGKTLVLEQINIVPKARTQGLGFYRWPTGWQGNATSGKTSITVSVDIEQQNNLFNWVLGAFAMGIVKGEVVIDTEKIKLYGLGELIL